MRRTERPSKSRPRAFVVALAVCALVGGCAALSGLGDLEEVSAPFGDGGAAPSDAATQDAPSSADQAPPPDSPIGIKDAPPPDIGSSDACATNLSGDTHNCGQCGHDCLGGGCTGGVCQPVAMATMLQDPGPIALDDSNVYFATSGDGFVWSIPKTGGAPKSFVDSLNFPRSIDVDSLNVYIADLNLGVISECGLGTSCSVGRVLISTPSTANVAVDTTHVFWTILGDAGPGVWVADKADGGNPKVLATTPDSPRRIALDAANVYFTTTGGNVMSISKSAIGSPLTLASGQIGPFGIAVDATTVYWVNTGGSVESCATTGCASPTELAGTNVSSPAGIAVDATDIYFTDEGAGTLNRCPLAGCPTAGPIAIASGEVDPYLVAMDDAAIYWTDRGTGSSDGKLWKLAK